MCDYKRLNYLDGIRNQSHCWALEYVPTYKLGILTYDANNSIQTFYTVEKYQESTCLGISHG